MQPTSKTFVSFFTIVSAFAVMALALAGGILLSMRKAQKNDEKIWDASSKRLIINFMIPLVTGGLFCLMLLERRLVMLVGPLTLIFYGLACLNASKYTIGDIRLLGMIEIGIGLLNLLFIGQGLLCWTLGFGIAHIVYGIYMWNKYDKN